MSMARICEQCNQLERICSAFISPWHCINSQLFDGVDAKMLLSTYSVSGHEGTNPLLRSSALYSRLTAPV